MGMGLKRNPLSRQFDAVRIVLNWVWKGDLNKVIFISFSYQLEMEAICAVLRWKSGIQGPD